MGVRKTSHRCSIFLFVHSTSQSPSEDNSFYKVCAVYAARNLQPKRKGAVCQASVIFGIGKEKFRTEVVRGNEPTWNEESVLKVTAQNASLVLTVMDKEDVLGHITLPVTQLPSAAHKRRWLPLKRKNQPTSSDLCFDCWVKEFKDDSVGIWNKLKTFSSGAPDPQPSPHEKRRNSVISASTGIKGSTSSLELYSKSLEEDKKDSIDDLQITPRNVSVVGKTNSSTDVSVTPSPRRTMADERAVEGAKLQPTLGALMSMKGPPEITGISPRFGPSTGGTKIIIRGCSLGVNKDDFLGFSICSCHCLDALEYHSPAKLTCITKPWNGSKPNPGPIVLVTKSGGRGVSTVEFEFKGKAVSSKADEKSQVNLPAENKSTMKEMTKKGRKGTSDQSSRDHDLLSDITKLRLEVQDLRNENQSLRSYIDKLMIVLMEQFPEALEATSKISPTEG